MRKTTALLVALLLAACSGGGESEEEGGGGESETTGSGLEIIHMVEGSGEGPGPTDTVVVHYHGTFPDGKVFDSSVQRGQPATFPLNRVIRCWTEGLQRMKTGGKSVLVCPAEIAYGDRGHPPRIAAGAALRFEVELIEIVKE